ncbi:Pycsar system effector family protein [Kribbella sp. NPDC023855]|uniref:Pycsar system effector family protein n=1 Tax=Kribbella sp. NPDC023855 TaxID=3154698 RepID=UPI003403CD1D
MTGIDPISEALQELKAAEDALSVDSELYRLRRAQVLATLAQVQPVDGGELAMAWRIHDAAAGSIGKADTKAGFVATLNTALLAGVLTLAHLDQLNTVSRALVSIGIFLMVAAVLFAVAVVLPILRARHTKHSSGNVLYFGTVRHHSPDGLADRLGSENAVREVCAQAVVLSRLSWIKHRLLQLSLIATIAGTNLVGWTLLLTGAAR